jgi:acyl-CoA reductase-like NAD-dependent aldehyde dehydrogenase
MNKFARFAAPVSLLALCSAAQAALPAAVTDSITTAGEDMVAAITAIIVAFVAFWGLKKLASKFGWV